MYRKILLAKPAIECSSSKEIPQLIKFYEKKPRKEVLTSKAEGQQPF